MWPCPLLQGAGSSSAVYVAGTLIPAGCPSGSRSLVGTQGLERHWCRLQTSPGHWEEETQTDKPMQTCEWGGGDPPQHRACLEKPSGWLQFAATLPPTSSWRKADGVNVGARRASGGWVWHQAKVVAISRFSHIMIYIVINEAFLYQLGSEVLIVL